MMKDTKICSPSIFKQWWEGAGGCLTDSSYDAGIFFSICQTKHANYILENSENGSKSEEKDISLFHSKVLHVWLWL